MKTLYEQGYSACEVGRQIGRSYRAVAINLQGMGGQLRDDSVRNRQYRLNEEYFASINTPEKAYTLGFIYADGNVRGNRLKVALWEKDRDLLQSMLNDMGSNAPIGTERPRQLTRSPMAILAVHGRVFCKHLRAQGVMEAKTQRIELPTSLSPELLRYFVLGYFDGDGCVYHHIDKERSFRSVATFAGHEGFIRSLQQYSALRVLNYLYQDLPKFYLTRKYDRYRVIVDTMQGRRAHKSEATIPHIDAGLAITLKNAA